MTHILKKQITSTTTTKQTTLFYNNYNNNKTDRASSEQGIKNSTTKLNFLKTLLTANFSVLVALLYIKKYLCNNGFYLFIIICLQLVVN